MMPVMLEIGMTATPILIHPEISYGDLFSMVREQGRSRDPDFDKIKLNSLYVIWNRGGDSRSFPEKSKVDQENLNATLALLKIRQGRDVLRADYEFNRDTLV